MSAATPTRLSSVPTHAANDDVEKPTRFLRLPDVVQRTGLSQSTIYRLVTTGDFPRQVKLTERTAAWIEAEVDAWIAERIRRRDVG